MKVASNKLEDLFTFYQTQLSTVYDEGELMAIFELVCERYLGYDKAELKKRFQENINQSELLKIYDAAKSLAAGKPIQYILGEAYFYNLKFRVNHSVLIPRPETEELVDIIIKQNNFKTVLDIGTGSGCIPVSIKKNLPGCKVYALEVSAPALETANTNAKANGAEVTFIHGNILTVTDIPNAPFDVIVSNPPYVLKSEAEAMTAQVLDHEPHLALFVEDTDPIIFYKRIIDLCLKNLSPQGYLFFELNPLYANEVKAYADASKLFNFTELIKDMSGKWRFLKARKS